MSVKRINARTWDSTGRLFPSSAGVNCELNLRYSFTGTEQQKQYVHHGKENKIGDAIHRELQKDFEERFGDKVEVEKYISHDIDGLTINGKVDIVLNGKLIIEIKTVKPGEGKEVDPTHVKQVQWYMGVLGIKKTVVSYFDRQNGIHINSFEVDYDEKMFLAIREKFQRVVNGGPRLRSDNRECKFCPYSYTCPNYKRPQWKKKGEKETAE